MSLVTSLDGRLYTQPCISPTEQACVCSKALPSAGPLCSKSNLVLSREEIQRKAGSERRERERGGSERDRREGGGGEGGEEEEREVSHEKWNQGFNWSFATYLKCVHLSSIFSLVSCYIFKIDSIKLIRELKLACETLCSMTLEMACLVVYWEATTALISHLSF